MGKIYILGDIHGKFHPIRDLINTVKDIDTIILLGDAGLNYYLDGRDHTTKKKINRYKVNIFVIRGNHEQRPSICMKNHPDDWRKETFWGNKVYVEKAYPHIKYALDCPAKYEIPTAQGEPLKTLVLPGAYSVDKYFRIENNLKWFKHEQCTNEEMGFGIRLAHSNTWDLVLSHTCPVAYEPTDLFLPIVNQSLVDKTTERWLGAVEYNLDYRLWCWGHYHALRVYPKYQNKEKIMLFNDYALDLYKYFFCNNVNIYDCLINIQEEKNNA